MSNDTLRESSRQPMRPHWPLLLATAALAACGVYNMHSSAGHRAPRLWLVQLAWLLIGACVSVPCATIDYRRSKAFAYGGLAAATAGLILVLVAGKNVMGARRWLAFGPLTVQPSELCKLALIAGLARYFSTRIVAQGYSIRRLVRPLLWTRPAAAAAALLFGWRRPWLLDPMGELARAVHRRLPVAPVPEELLWFRVSLACLLASTLVGSVLAIRALARRAELLHPWPQQAERRACLASVFVHVALLALLAWQSQAPALCDPTAVALAALHRAGGPTGAWAEPAVHAWPRACLCLLLLGWGALAWAFGRSPGPTPAASSVAPVDLVALPSLLVLVQPDLGSALMLMACGGTMVFVVGLRGRSLVYLGALGVATSWLAWFAVLKEYQKRRIWTFIDPEQDLRGAGWNAVQSLIAVGSGRAVGKGHKNGTQTQLSFLPEQHTDFAFSVWAEEQGFLGCAFVLALYLMLALFGLQIARRARDAYGALLATGVTALVLWQAVINAGMVIGVLPVVGIPLPLFSYGGSSVLTLLAGIGILQNVAMRERPR